MVKKFHAFNGTRRFITIFTRARYWTVCILNHIQPDHTRVYPKVSGLAAWSENCKWYSSLPLSAVVSLYYESV
jgi:hypothetical protein